MVEAVAFTVTPVAVIADVAKETVGAALSICVSVNVSLPLLLIAH